MENNNIGSLDDELLKEVQIVRRKLRETIKIFDWKHFLIPQITLVGALACSTFSLYEFSLISYSLFLGSFSILAVLYWIVQSFRNKRIADQVQEMGLELIAYVTSSCIDRGVVKEGKELYREIELHEAIVSKQTSHAGSTILIYISLFLGWLTFTVGDISHSVSRYESTVFGNIFIVIAMLLVFKNMTWKKS